MKLSALSGAAALVLSLGLMSGCTTIQTKTTDFVSKVDPFEDVNRSTFEFNNKFDNQILRAFYISQSMMTCSSPILLEPMTTVLVGVTNNLVNFYFSGITKSASIRYNLSVFIELKIFLVISTYMAP